MKTPAVFVSLMTATIIVSASCSDHSTGNAGISQTPRITTGVAPAQLSADLVGADDLRASGFPADAQLVPVNDVKVFEDPDPRGPCGAPVPKPDLSHAAGVGIRSSAVSGVEFVTSLPAQQATTFVSAYLDDSRPGCPSFESTTNTGSRQHMTLVRVVDVGAVGDQHLGAVMEFSNQGQSGRASLVLLRKHNLVALATLISANDPPDSLLRGLAQHMAGKIA